MKRYFLSIFALIFAFIFANANTRIMVFSDPHVLDPSLTPSIGNQPRLVEHSAELFDEAIARVISSKPDILLIPGDLTNDGEQASHNYVSSCLDSLINLGIQVYIVPGNHDISELTASEFENLYMRCGYGAAVCRMPGTLSYMVYPAPGLALICFDSNLPNKPTHQSAGGLNEATLAWGERAAAQARADGRYIIGMMHHQVAEHFSGQAEFDANHIANSAKLPSDYPALTAVQTRLVNAGFSVMLTGHFHIHSIQRSYVTPGLTDVSTGSLSGYGSPIRTMEFADSVLTISTEHLSTFSQLAAERNAITVRGAFHQLAPKAYKNLLAKIPELIKDPAVVQKMRIPESATQLEQQLNDYFLESGTAFLNALTLGDEDMHNPDKLYRDIKKDMDRYMNYVINGAKYTKKVGIFRIDLIETLLKPTFYGIVNPYIYSVLYNYVNIDDRTTTGAHYAADGSATLMLPSPVAIANPAASSQEPAAASPAPSATASPTPSTATSPSSSTTASPGSAAEQIIRDGQELFNAFNRLFPTKK